MSCPDRPTEPTVLEKGHPYTSKGCLHWFDSEDSDPSISSQKARPWIIIGRNNFNSSRVIMCPVSDLEHYLEKGKDILKYPYHSPLYKEEYPFLEKDSVVLLDQAYTIAKSDLCEEWYIGRVSDCTQIDLALAYNYDMFESIYLAYSELLKELPDHHKANYSRK